MNSNYPEATYWRLELRSSTSKVLFCLVVLLYVAALLWQTTRVVLSQTWGYSLDLHQTEKALALDPTNERFHYALGIIQLADPDQQNRDSAVAALRSAVQLNPRWARAWSGLAKACYMSNDLTCEQEAVRKTIHLAPSNPEYAWDAAIYGVMSGNSEAATSGLKRYLAMRPERRYDAYRLLLNGFGSPDVAWNTLLSGPSSAAGKAEYVGFLAQTGDFQAAERYWNELSSTNTPVDAESARLYLDLLLAAGKATAAEDVWQYLLRSDSNLKQGQVDESNLVYNGDFEKPPSGLARDWRYQKLAYLNLNLRAVPGYESGYALGLEFTAPANESYEPINQLVPVQPATTYTLSAMVRSESITSDSGPRINVTVPNCTGCLDVSTQSTVGTTPWHLTDFSFTTGPTTDLVLIRIYRPRGHSYPPEITGRAWFDKVSLRSTSTSQGFTKR